MLCPTLISPPFGCLVFFFWTKPAQPVPSPTNCNIGISAAGRGCSLTRDRLAFLLWPDEAQPVARNRLRMTLFGLPRVADTSRAADLIVTAGDAVSLNLVRVHCDVREFLKLTEQCLQNQAHQDYSHSTLARAEETEIAFIGESLWRDSRCKVGFNRVLFNRAVFKRAAWSLKTGWCNNVNAWSVSIAAF